MDLEPQGQPSQAENQSTPLRIYERYEYASDTKKLAAKLADQTYDQFGKYGTKVVSRKDDVDYNLEKTRLVKEAADGTLLLFTHSVIEEPHIHVQQQKDNKGVKKKVQIPGRLKTVQLKVEPYLGMSADGHAITDPSKFLTYGREVFTATDSRYGAREAYEGRFHKSNGDSQFPREFAKLALESVIDPEASSDLYDQGKQGTNQLNGVISHVYQPGDAGPPSFKL